MNVLVFYVQPNALLYISVYCLYFIRGSHKSYVIFNILALSNVALISYKVQFCDVI